MHAAENLSNIVPAKKGFFLLTYKRGVGWGGGGGAILSWCENSVNSQQGPNLLLSFPPLGLSKLPGLALRTETEPRQRNPLFENKTNKINPFKH